MHVDIEIFTIATNYSCFLFFLLYTRVLVFESSKNILLHNIEGFSFSHINVKPHKSVYVLHFF